MLIFKANDNAETLRIKTFLVRGIGICVLGVLLVTLVAPVASLAMDGYEPNDVGAKNVVYLVCNLAFIIFLLICLGSIHFAGITSRLKIGLIILPMIWTIATCLNSGHAELFRFMIIILDAAVVLGAHDSDIVVIRIGYGLLCLFVLAMTLEVYDAKSDGKLGVYFWGRSSPTSAVYMWILFVVPTLLNFVLMQKYTTSVNKQQKASTCAVDVVKCVADKLANYDLDAAEKLLSKGEFWEGASDMREPLSRLLRNLRAYSPFLPNSLFLQETHEVQDQVANKTLASLMQGKEATWGRIETAVERMQDPDYSLLDFHEDIVEAFPELMLYLDVGHAQQTTSGLTTSEEYQRTLSALYSVYCFLRLDIDGKEVFAYGIDANGRPCEHPSGPDSEKKQKFYETMPWETVTELLMRAGLLEEEKTWGEEKGMNAATFNGRSGSFLNGAAKTLAVVPGSTGLSMENTVPYFMPRIRRERVIAMLALTAIHDVMKNPAMLPNVQPRHAPYRGYGANEQIADHDIALAYILEHFPTLLPSFKALEPAQRAPILFTQNKMCFNNGWLVQGEAPPGPLFAKFKQLIGEGRASQTDIDFYFVHWLTDLAGAVPFGAKSWPGAEQFTMKFPVHVLSAFLESFGYVDRLATDTEVEIMEEYLNCRWLNLGLRSPSFKFESDIAIMRLALMAQGFEADLVAAFQKLPFRDNQILTEEMARTGRKEQFTCAPKAVKTIIGGPALLIYYAPALIQKAKGGKCVEALRVLAAVFRAARRLFPLNPDYLDQSATVRIDALKVLDPIQIFESAPWHLRRTSSVDAEAVRGPPDSDEAVCTLINLQHSGDFEIVVL